MISVQTRIVSSTSRRDFLRLLLVCISSFIGVTGYAFVLPGREESHKFGFEDFHLLSQLLTKTKELDEKVSREIFNLIIMEPWGIEHISQIYIRIQNIQLRTEDKDNFLIKPEDFTEGEQWFISHLLLTWFTGIYFHERGNIGLTLQHSLMYQNLSQYRQPPTYCSGTPGSWSNPPV